MMGGKTWDEWIEEYSEGHQHPINQLTHKFGEANRAEGGDGWQLMADFANDHADHTAAIREKSLALVARLAKVFTDCEGLAYDHDIDNELTALKAALEGNDEDTDA